MASLNKVTLIGNVGRDPETRHTADGTAIVNMTLATTHKSKGQEETEWHRLTIFGQQAEVAEKYVRKGTQIYAEGRLRSRKYTGKDGVERTSVEVLVERFLLLGGKGSATQADAPQAKAQTASASFGSDDVPF
jgi:single-strand DNA-binding protein